MVVERSRRVVEWTYGFGTSVVALAAASVLLLAPASPAGAGGPAGAAGFPCEDLNKDGRCVAGEDVDISAALAQTGSFSTSGDIVIPANAKGISVRGDLYLFADGKITIHGDVRGDAVMVYANTLVLGDNASLKAGDWVDLSGTTGIAGGKNVSISAPRGYLYLWSWEGDVTFGAGSKLSASEGIDISTSGLGVTIGQGARWRTNRGTLRIYAAGDVVALGSSFEALSTFVYTESHLIDFRDNVLKVMKDGDAFFLTEGSTIDLRGTRFKNLDPAHLTISATTILQ